MADLEHVHGDDVDDHDPAGTVEQLHVVLDEGDGRDALHLQLAPVRVGAFQFARHVLLELFHVEQLKNPSDHQPKKKKRKETRNKNKRRTRVEDSAFFRQAKTVGCGGDRRLGLHGNGRE